MHIVSNDVTFPIKVIPEILLMSSQVLPVNQNLTDQSGHLKCVVVQEVAIVIQ